MKIIFLRFLRKSGLIKYLNLFLTKSLYGKKVKIPILQGLGIGNFLYPSEPWMYTLISKLIRNFDQGIFLDIGANIGQTMIKVKLSMPYLSYIGLEPNPTCNHYLETLISANKFSDTRILPIGISTNSGILSLNLYNEDNTDSSASIIPNFRASSNIRRSLSVPILEFDIIQNQIPRIAIMKIDVEGAELEVLTSLRDRIKLDQPIILLEILPVYTTENEFRLNRQKQIESIISATGYRISRIIKKDNLFKKLVEIQEFGVHSELGLCDYVLFPESKKEILEETLANK